MYHGYHVELQFVQLQASRIHVNVPIRFELFQWIPACSVTELDYIATPFSPMYLSLV